MLQATAETLAGPTRVGPYALARLLGAGPDGARYLAITDAGESVELWRLRPESVTPELARRVELLAGLDHPALLTIRTRALAGLEPYLAVALRGRFGEADAWPEDERALAAGLASLASGLAAAHRLGIVHGSLGLQHIGWDESGGVVLDLIGAKLRDPRTVREAPEWAAGPPVSATDVFALAAIVRAARPAAAAGLAALLDAMQRESPEARPSAAEVASRLAEATDPTAAGIPPTRPTLEPTDEEALPERLGPYLVLDALGEGAMGRVHRARDMGGGPEVALKVLLQSWASDQDMLRRFRREARLLQRIQSPYVTRFISANEDEGFHYLAMELVPAPSAGALLVERGRLATDLACAIATDTAAALGEVHQLGLIHRDVKPGNLLVIESAERPLIKLCDFGIARPMEPVGEELTVVGTPGTPTYMAPEQLEGGHLDARADVYALGITLYCLLAGRPPFIGSMSAVVLAHVQKPPPMLRGFAPEVPGAIEDVVMRCLAKDREERFPDGAALREALFSAWRGSRSSSAALPQPIGLEGKPLRSDFVFDLASSPEALWPMVSNTERFNRAAGLDDVSWVHRPGEGYVETVGSFRAAGMRLEWKENPFEWVAPRRLGVVREYTSGPFEWLRNHVELEGIESGGTRLTHRVELSPRNLLGRVAASVEVGFKLRRSFERVYRHVDAFLQGAENAERVDAFEPPPPPSETARSELDRRLEQVVARGADPFVAAALSAHLLGAPAPELARIRPRALARAHDLDERAVLDACLLATAEGVLTLLWDLLCPACRVPSDLATTLRALKDHGRCEVCDLDYALDLARSVELVFRPHPSIREADLGVYCIGGPAHSPHVVAQLRLEGGGLFDLELDLEPGRYQVGGRGFDARYAFGVEPGAPLSRWDLAVGAGAPTERDRRLATGGQRIVLTNDLPHEVLVRVERAAERTDVLSAADAASSARFRELFPGEVLSPEQLVSISEVSLLFVQIPDALSRYERDEAAMHEALVKLAEALAAHAEAEGGARVKLSGDGALAVFTDRAAATRAALALLASCPEAGVAVHAGPARVTSVDDRLEYFGRVVHTGEQMVRWAEAGELCLPESIGSAATLLPLLGEETRLKGTFQLGPLLVWRLLRWPVSSSAPPGVAG